MLITHDQKNNIIVVMRAMEQVEKFIYISLETYYYVNHTYSDSNFVFNPIIQTTETFERRMRDENENNINNRN